MKVCGFSFVRNGVKFDYPFVESIRSILPVCDEVIVAAGDSDDNTTEILRSIDPKVKVIPTVWDPHLRRNGAVLAQETDKAFQAIPSTYDWAFYIQGDEVIHERYLPAIRAAMEQHLDNSDIEGLLFKYLHFFGSYDFIGTKYSWYRREIRIVRNRKDIFSYRDAQGFRKTGNEKLKVRLIDAFVYHYGWVRRPDALRGKEQLKMQLYTGDGEFVHSYAGEIGYHNAHEPVRRFNGTHPAVMQDRIRQQNWQFEPDLSLRYASFKDRIKRMIGEATGWYPGEYRNYRMI